MIEPHIWKAAEQMVKRHGDAAEIAASVHAAYMLDHGNASGFYAWKRIVDVIGGLDRDRHAESGMKCRT
jgi:hypothetical protein